MKQNLNFTEINRLIKALTDIDEYLDLIYSDRGTQEERIRDLCVRILRKDAERKLDLWVSSQGISSKNIIHFSSGFSVFVSHMS